MSRLELPNVVMIDLLSTSCSRYMESQVPALYYTRFENGRSLGIQRARRQGKRILRCRDLQVELRVIIEEILRQISHDGYGEAQLCEVCLGKDCRSLSIEVRLPKPSCENQGRLSDNEGMCNCYAWLWRGILNGLTCEIGWLVREIREESNGSSGVPLKMDERKNWEARAKSSLSFKRLYITMSVRLVLQ